MASNTDELTISYTENGVETIKELDKVVLTKGAWATLVFRYMEWDQRKNDYGPEKYSIRRYQKRDGTYRQRSKFNISSPDQAKQLIEVLQGWLATE